jgi:hypothetical protein
MMKNKSKMLPALGVLIALTLAFPAYAEGGPPVASAISAETPDAQILTIQGHVLQAGTETPLKGVYVRQKNALNATYTDEKGHFSLRLLRGFSPELVFQAEGYEDIGLNFTKNPENLQVKLQPLTEYRSDLPAAHNDPALSSALPQRLFNNQFSLIYQGRYGIFNQGNVNIQGITINEWMIDTDLMPFYPLTFRGRFFRARTPIDIQGFPFQPAFYINHQQAKVGAGWSQTLANGSDFYYGLDFILDNRSPNNRNPQDNLPVAFTGSNLDFQQNRLGAGFNALWALPLSDRLTLMPEFTVYPVVLNFIDRPTNAIDYTVAGDLGAKLRFEIIPGAYAVARYSTQLWYGFGGGDFENNHFLQVGVSLDPWTLSERLLK